MDYPLSAAISVTQELITRDHTERMLSSMGVDIIREQLGATKTKISLGKKREVRAQDIEIFGDFSSASFFIVAALLTPDSSITIKNVGINQTRTGFLEILKSMGANISILNKRIQAAEEVGDICVRSSELTSCSIGKEEVSLSIDEIPLLALVACFSRGVSTISGAAELRVKESDRISVMTDLLSSSGASIEEKEDGFVIKGRPELLQSGGTLGGEKWRNELDHRIIMSASVLNYLLNSQLSVIKKEVVETSFPNFYQQFQELIS